MRVRHPPGAAVGCGWPSAFGPRPGPPICSNRRSASCPASSAGSSCSSAPSAPSGSSAWSRCQTWIARAAILRGQPRDLARRRSPAAASVDLVWRNSMGAYYPAEAACLLPEERRPRRDRRHRGDGRGRTRPSDALERAVQLAATDRAVREVDRELAATRRRLRMLQRQWLPSLGAALHALDIELEERERDDIMHARWANAEGSAR